MARKVSLYLSDRALELARVNDSLSGRLNVVADRYTELLRHSRDAMRKRFDAAHWHALAAVCRLWTAEPAAAIVGAIHLELAERLRAAGMGADQVDTIASTIAAMAPAERILLVELLEAERGSAPRQS